MVILEDIYLKNIIVHVRNVDGIKLILNQERFRFRFIILMVTVLITKKITFNYYVQIVIL